LIAVATGSGKENIVSVNSAVYFIRYYNAARAFNHLETGIYLTYIQKRKSSDAVDIQ
jgi:hypothetical protein